MNLNTQRKIAAKILKCGETRVWMNPAAQEKIKKAITRRDVRGLIKDGLVKKSPEKKSLRLGPKSRILQESKGRRSGCGSRKGALGARAGKKGKWLKTVRPQRNLLKSLRSENKILKDYGSVYKQIKGGAFRSKHHLISHLEEHKLAKVSVAEYETAEKARKLEAKKQDKAHAKKAKEKLNPPAKAAAENKAEVKNGLAENKKGQAKK